MYKLIALGVLLVGLTGVFVPMAVGYGQGVGHSPVIVCHWVPAHGGSYVVIVVDDDGATGNKNLEAHKGHPNDAFPAPGEGCPNSGGID